MTRVQTLAIGLLAVVGIAACSSSTQSPLICPAQQVVIDVGHTEFAPGATAASGATEHSYNRRFAALLTTALLRRTRNVQIVAIAGDDPRLDRRVEAVRSATHGAAQSLVLSIHHDSVQERYLKPRVVDGEKRFYTDAATGFSLFVPTRTPVANDSLTAARAIADALIGIGERPSLHHAEPIEGENRNLLDTKRGIYAGDFLKILRTADTPVVLIEIAVIKNPVDEARLSNTAVVAAIAEAIAAGAVLPCSVNSRSTARTAG